MRKLLALALVLATSLALACGASGDDLACTTNGGVCTSGGCTTGTLPYSCGSGGSCCKVPPDSGK